MEQEPEPEPQPRLRFSALNFLIGFGVGSFVGVTLALIAFAIAQDSNASDPQEEAPIVAVATATPIPGATATPDTRPRTLAALEVRLGPGDAFAIIGTISRGEAVEVIGRDAGAAWAAIRFPPGSAARGWLPVSQLNGLTDLEGFSVLLPTPLPRSVSTPTFSTNDGGSSRGTPTPTPARSSSTPAVPGPAGKPDLVVNAISRLSDGRVRVVVGNQGPGDFVALQIFVLVREGTAFSELVIHDIQRLAVGATIAVETSDFRVNREAEIDALVDPFNNVDDANPGNNLLRVTLAPPRAATPTATQLPDT